MKIHKMINIDIDLHRKLKDFNASSLIEELLYKYFSKLNKSETEIIEEVKEKIKETEEKENNKEKRENETNHLKETLLKEIESQELEKLKDETNLQERG